MFLRANYGAKIGVEYNDQLFFKTDKGDDKALNLIDMKFFDPKNLKTRFNNPEMYGFLEKVSCNWRSKVSFLFGGTTKWVKKLYVLKNGSMYVYEENNYDKPSKVFKIGDLTMEKCKPMSGKNHVFKLVDQEQDNRTFAVANLDEYNQWIEAIVEAIDDAKERNHSEEDSD